MHCQVPGIDYSLSKLAIHAALESATAIALSHTGILYIAETDEKKINRVRQVRGWAQRIVLKCFGYPFVSFKKSLLLTNHPDCFVYSWVVFSLFYHR